MSQLSTFVYLRDFYCWGEGGWEEFELASLTLTVAAPSLPLLKEFLMVNVRSQLLLA